MKAVVLVTNIDFFYGNNSLPTWSVVLLLESVLAILDSVHDFSSKTLWSN